jgi:dienelactone hydrolase
MIEPQSAARQYDIAALRNRILRGSVATMLALVASASCAAASTSFAPAAATPSTSSSSTLYLLKPTGPHPVGTTSLYLKDTSRPDPWVPTAKARELMVSLWYPAKSPGKRRAQYVTPKEAELILKGGEITAVSADTLSKTRTNAFSDVKPAGHKRSLPLVVLSPGFQLPRTTLTGLAEDLASNGYVVAGIDHTYESFATTFPDGRVTTCVACEATIKTDKFWKKVVQSRAADTSFVLDELTGSHPKWKGNSLIDPSRIAMSGHSIGGASSLEAMVKDSRIRAGINMDGTTYDSIPQSGLSRPFLFLGTQAKHKPGDGAATWDRDWKLLTGWKRWLVVAGSVHGSFNDMSLLADQFGLDYDADLSGARSLEIIRRYTRAFFDQHLRNKPQPLLDKPSTRYSEVKFCSVETKTCE